MHTYFCNSRGEDLTLIVPDLEYKIPDYRRINGSIELTIFGTAVLDRGMWDLTDLLWIDLVSMLDTLHTHDTATIKFPDQPLEFSLQRLNRVHIRASSKSPERRAAVVAEADLVRTIREAGVEFFQVMNRLHPRNYYDRVLEQLRALQ